MTFGLPIRRGLKGGVTSFLLFSSSSLAVWMVEIIGVMGISGLWLIGGFQGSWRGEGIWVVRIWVVLVTGVMG